MRPDISVIIVSYNVAGLLADCLNSLLNRPSDNLNLEIIVVDNASHDDSVPLIKDNFPHVRLIANTENYGFPAGCNQGWRISTGKYIFFLNPDATVAPDCLGKLVKFMERNPATGICGPLVRYGDGTVQSSRRRFPGPGLALVESTILQRYYPFKRLPALKKFYFDDVSPDTTHEVDWLMGAALFCRREAIEQVGGFDERFFMYSEEIDLCRQVKKAGWDIWFYPQAIVTHLEGRSSAQDVPRRHINFNTSKVSYFRKHYGLIYGWFLRNFLLATYVFQFGEEGLKLLLKHKPDLRRQRLALIRQVLASRLKPGKFPRPPHSQGVVLISAEFPPQPGGVGDYTNCLAEEFSRQVNTRVLTGEHPEAESHPNQVIRLKGKWGWQKLPQIAAYLDNQPASAINIQYQTGAYGMQPAINFLPLYLRWRLGKARPRVITTFHDLRVPYLFPKAGPVRTWVNKLLLKSSDRAVLTNPEDFSLALAWGAKPEKLSQIPIGNNIKPVSIPDEQTRFEIRRRLGIEDNNFLIGYFGLLNESKGVDTLLEALAKLPTNLNWKLLIIGGVTGESDTTNQKYASKLKDQIARLGLDNRLSWTGYLTETETSQALYALDLMALPFKDGISLRRGSLLAALAHGLPVVSCRAKTDLAIENGYGNIGEIQLLLQKSVMLVEAENPARLAGSIARLYQDPALRAELGKYALELSRYFSWDTIARNFLEVFTAC